MAQPTPTWPDEWANEHYVDSAARRTRVPVALYLDDIPIAPSRGLAVPHLGVPGGQDPKGAPTSGGGAGYGPPEPPTPLLQKIHATLQSERGADYDAVAIPLTNQHWKTRWDRLCVDGGRQESPMPGSGSSAKDAADVARDAELWRLAGHFNRNEVNLTRQSEALKSICIASQWLELDSPIEGIRLDSELALKQEVQYASYLHITNLLLPPPRYHEYISDYARAISSALAVSNSVFLSIQIPVSDLGSVRRPDAPDRLASWEDWATIYKLCGSHPRLTVTLDMTYFVSSPHLLSRWVAEPVANVYIPASSFISNAKQYPVLSKSCQELLRGLLRHTPTVILAGTAKGLHTSGGASAYVQYLRFIERKVPQPDPIEQYAGTLYLDHLQAPLQPLADHLESQTYTGFEMDPEKYSAYERAIHAALTDRPATSHRTYTIFVCGAGRGPLVEACLRAGKTSGRSVKIIAIEKSPTAFVTLQERQALEWGSNVTIHCADMRTFKPPEKADIIVSELLGSFGDNELSPECIDGAIRWLKDDGISIPQDYGSYVAPISSSRLHSRVVESGRIEMPYVVMIHKASIVSENGGYGNRQRIAEAWTFAHNSQQEIVRDLDGIPITNCHNSRSAHMTFSIPTATTCHGFGGYFSATLYGNITLDIRPDKEMSRKMLSWFPIFFPFKEPLYLPGRSELEIHLWRLTDGQARRVWYEWSADVFLPVSALAAAVSSNGTTATHQSSSGSSVDPSPAPTPMLDALQSPGMSPQTSHTGELRLRIASTSLHNPGGSVSAITL